MTVFKCYMKILKQNLGLVFLYLGIFFSVSIVLQMAAQKGEDSLYQTTSIDLGVVNLDDSLLSSGFVDYLSQIHHVTIMENDPETLQENLFYAMWNTLFRFLLIFIKPVFRMERA